MQQRQLRLGDILDDYCPRERRLANHTIVAMVGAEIRLTRCTTCDTEHPFKGGKAPRLRKKKPSVEAASSEVLPTPPNDDEGRNDGAAESDAGNAAPVAPTNGSGAPDASGTPEEVRLHRPLIRAQLPTLGREPIARQIPEFTIRQANKRQGRFQNSRPPGRFAKDGGGGGAMNRSGPGNSRGPGGPQHGTRQGGGRPQGHGSSPTRPGGGRHSGHNPDSKKRSR